MKDEPGNVVIRNFYDDVVPLTATEQKALDGIPNIDANAARGVRPGAARASRQPHRGPAQPADAQRHRHRVRRRSTRGTRSAIPGSASARLEMRLVKGLSADQQLRSPRSRTSAQQGYSIVIESEPRCGHQTPAPVDRARHARRRRFSHREDVDGRRADGDRGQARSDRSISASCSCRRSAAACRSATFSDSARAYRQSVSRW